MLFVVINDHINNLDPAMESPTGADEEIIFIENLQYVPL